MGWGPLPLADVNLVQFSDRLGARVAAASYRAMRSQADEQAPGGAQMALYEFECASCGERFEVARPMAEHERLREQPPLCPKCGQQARELMPLVSCKIATG